MKKEIRFLFLASLIVLAIFSVTILAHAEDIPGLTGIAQNDSIINAVQSGQEQYEQYTTAENKSAYLTEKWGEIIGKAAYIGPIHNFLSSSKVFFKILFAYPYEISFTFFFVIFIWFIVLFQLSKIFSSLGILNKNFSLPSALLFTIILAQIQIFNFIAKGITNLMFSSDTWWARLIIFILACSIIIALSILSNYTSKYLKAQREKERLNALEQSTKEANALIQGVQEGQSLTN